MKTQWLAGILAGVLLLGGCARVPEETRETTQPPAVIYTYPVETIPTTPPEPEDGDFVRILDYIPEAYQALPYATTENFTGTVIYDFTDAWLRYGTVKKLKAVSDDLAQLGLTLKIWDGFRPVAAQKKLWEVYPNSAYVSNPANGLSPHCRGNTVDLTLVSVDGSAVEMPTGFDDFSEKADRDYSDVEEVPTEHALLLQNTMEKYGFEGYFGEWWHFQDEISYPVEDVFEPVNAERYYAQCNEFINLRTHPDTAAEVIVRIPKDDEFTVLALCGTFALAEYEGIWGYVHRDFIQPVAVG